VTRRRIISGLLVASLASVLVYAILAALTDAQAVGQAIRDFPPETFAAMLALSLVCYVLRAVRWRYYARVLGYSASWRDTFYLHFSGMTMTVTPGKLGEVLKAYLGRELVGMPMTRGVTLLFTERLADLIAVLVLSTGGLSLVTGGWLWFPGALGVVFAGTLVLSSERFHAFALRTVSARPWMRRHDASTAAVSETFRATLSLKTLAVAIPISVVAWGAEGFAFYLCLRALGFDGLGFSPAVAAYAVSTVIGALAFMPGGVGLTEASLTGLCIAAGASGSVATAATVLIRIATLWFGVALGWVVFATRPSVLRGFVRGRDEDADPAARTKHAPS
jgi:uncharacterized protein (TIRG00374 family)